MRRRIDQAEFTLPRATGLGGTQHQKAPFLQREVEGFQQLFLMSLVEIDEQIAAADEIEPGKRRVGQQVLPGEHHLFAQMLAHPVT